MVQKRNKTSAHQRHNSSVKYCSLVVKATILVLVSAKRFLFYFETQQAKNNPEILHVWLFLYQGTSLLCVESVVVILYGPPVGRPPDAENRISQPRHRT